MRASIEELRSNAAYYKLEPQAVNETDLAFNDRVIGALRELGVNGDAGALIIAHELESGRRWDDPDVDGVSGPLAGVTGAMAQVLDGDVRGFGRAGVGFDVGLGVYINSGAAEAHAQQGEALRAAFETLGPDVTLAMLGAGSPSPASPPADTMDRPCCGVPIVTSDGGRKRCSNCPEVPR